MRIWIDLANTPHVLFFEPVIAELERRGHTVTVTARRFANTLPLAAARGVRAHAVGAGHDADRDEAAKQLRHRERVAELVAFARDRFDVAVSHVSYTQGSAARALGLPIFAAIDYEHPGLRSFGDARCLMVPAVIPPAAFEACGIPRRILRPYDGLKEHVYLAGFQPDPTLRQRLGIADDERLIAFRPIAHHAVYTDPRGDLVQQRLVEHLASQPGARLVVLPRTAAQADDYETLARRRPAIRVLHEVVDGPSLICASDLVVCGGGTMLREAAVLGVPAVTVFSGRIGGVDRWLAAEGRIAVVQSEADATRVTVPERRRRPFAPIRSSALPQIVAGICDMRRG
jgi:predicted glycosyltransferase